ncbi:hypothetical protein HDV00_009313 [Rhizophlyctis rosea]|nr:hypothetical protein HDV00_009313 [Rhizophlyctis rosea]
MPPKAKSAKKRTPAAALDMGGRFGRPDLDRIGLFSEAPYISVNDPFDERKARSSALAERTKGKQFITGPPKRGHDTKDVYFEKDFGRLFENEGYTDLVVLRRRWRLQAKERNIVPAPFKPTSVPPKPSGKGSIYGTIEQQWPVFKEGGDTFPSFAETRPYEKPESKINFLTRPPKAGTGYGYPNVTIGKPPEYISTPYNAADEAARKFHALHKQKVVGERPFNSSISQIDYFNAFTTLSTAGGNKPRPATSKEKPTGLPPVPFKPPSAIGFTINKYPNYEPPPANKKAEAAEAALLAAKTAPGIFHPGGAPKTYPIRSVIDANIPLAPPHWIQDSLDGALRSAKLECMV